MRTEHNPELAKAVQRIIKLNAQSKDIGFEIGEIADAAFEAGHIRDVPNKTCARKVLKRLAKDSAMDEVEREEQRLIEESIDTCRAALGLLADLPLGQAVQVAHTGANGHANVNGEVKRRSGRPKGARNKPKAQPVADAAQPVADVPLPNAAPPIPDWPQ